MTPRMRIHFDIWQNQYNYVKFKNKIKLKKIYIYITEPTSEWQARPRASSQGACSSKSGSRLPHGVRAGGSWWRRLVEPDHVFLMKVPVAWAGGTIFKAAEFSDYQNTKQKMARMLNQSAPGPTGAFRSLLQHRVGVGAPILSPQPLPWGCAHVLQSCPTRCSPTDCSPPDSSVHEILQPGMLEWVAMPSPRGSSRPRDQTRVSYAPCTGSSFFTPLPGADGGRTHCAHPSLPSLWKALRLVGPRPTKLGLHLPQASSGHREVSCEEIRILREEQKITQRTTFIWNPVVVNLMVLKHHP